ncbi:RsmE family RNA methyltransferase [Weissella kandleri]|uniref:RsmE family RNA methyltransferase n=1 Tax=Weissella kandleri TaxID=1616 RepID=UPI00387E903D
MQRYFLNQTAQNEPFPLDEKNRHHLMTVLRGQVGTKLELVDNQQNLYLAEVVEVAATDTMVKIKKPLTSEVAQLELPVAVTLILGLAKGDKPELVVQKATELGVQRIIFTETQWSVVHWGSKAERKLVRLQKIAEGAAEQSHRLSVPTVEYYASLKQVPVDEQSVRMVAWEESAKQGEKRQFVKMIEAAMHSGRLTAVIGPEGGLSGEELAWLQENDFTAAGLGPRILRAETAPLYLLSAVSYATELLMN